MALPSRGSSLGQIVAYNGYNYQWTGTSWLNIGQASSAIGNTSITGAGVSVGTTSVTSTAVSVGSTSVSNTGLSVGTTSVTKTAVTVGSTTLSNTGVSVGSTSVTKTAVTVGSTAVSNTGVSIGSTSVTKTAVTVGSTTVSNTGISVGSVAVSTGGISVGSVTVSNTSVSIGSVSLSSTGVSLGGTSTISATTYTGTANNSIHLGGIASSLYLLESVANTRYQTKTSGSSTLANTNSYIATKASWTALTGTNTALRTLISDRIQVANTVAFLAGKASWSALTGTNTAIRALVSDRYQVANINSNFLKKTGTVPQVVDPNVSFSANVAIQGKLIVYGGVQTYSSNNLTISDNMIYLNSGSIASNPDIGFAGNYNDGVYHHTGFFRDASDAGTWKVFENYSPEPDANTFINTAHATFRLAPFSAQNIRVTRNLTVVANTSVGNTVIAGTLTANGSTGTAGYYLRSSNTGIYWSPVAIPTIASVNATSQVFSGTGSQTNFSLSSAVSQQKNVIITVNGLLQIPVTHYTISGSTLSFTSAPYSGAIIEARNFEGVITSGGSGGGGTISSGDLFIGSMLLGGM